LLRFAYGPFGFDCRIGAFCSFLLLFVVVVVALGWWCDGMVSRVGYILWSEKRKKKTAG
jgi:hypothetical protein